MPIDPALPVRTLRTTRSHRAERCVTARIRHRAANVISIPASATVSAGAGHPCDFSRFRHRPASLGFVPGPGFVSPGRPMGERGEKGEPRCYGDK